MKLRDLKPGMKFAFLTTMQRVTSDPESFSTLHTNRVVEITSSEYKSMGIGYSNAEGSVKLCSDKDLDMEVVLIE